MRDQYLLQLGTGFITLLGTVFTGIMAYMMARLQFQQKVFAYESMDRVEQVRKTLLQNTKETTDRLRESTEVLKINTEHVKEQRLTNIEKLEELKAETAHVGKNVEKVNETVTVAALYTGSNINVLSKMAEENAIVARATHSLVNSAMTEQLRRIAILTKRLAADNDPAAITEAERAEEAYQEQLRRQAIVDGMPGTDEQKKGNNAE